MAYQVMRSPEHAKMRLTLVRISRLPGRPPASHFESAAYAEPDIDQFRNYERSTLTFTVGHAEPLFHIPLYD